MDCAFGRTHPLSETVPDPVLLTERPTVSRAASATGTREDHITLDPAVNMYSHKWNRIWSNVQPDEPPVLEEDDVLHQVLSAQSPSQY